MPIKIDNPKTVKELKDIRSQINILHDRQNEIEEDVREKANKKLIGKCFKVKNCYSCPEKPSDYWWLYKRVDSTEGTFLKVKMFQTDQYGKTTIELNNMLMSVDLSCEISHEEFNKAWSDTMSKLSDL